MTDEFKLTDNGIEPKHSEEINEIINRVVGNKKEIKEIPKPKELPKAEELYYPEKKVEEPEIPKEIKKEKIQEFNENIKKNPITKDHKLISKTNILGMWITIGVLILIILVGMIWFNSSFNKKNFSPTVNNQIEVQPNNVSVPVSNTYNIYNNFTIQNNLTLPNTLKIKLMNSS
jgi:hypothetical protein